MILFFICKITAIYYLCFKCKKTINVIPSNSWTLSREAKYYRTLLENVYHPSRKQSKINELDMRDTAGEVGTNS